MIWKAGISFKNIHKFTDDLQLKLVDHSHFQTDPFSTKTDVIIVVALLCAVLFTIISIITCREKEREKKRRQLECAELELTPLELQEFRN